MSSPITSSPGPWYSELNGYYWWVLMVATLGWLFDSMDQRLFVLVRTPALRELVPHASDAEITGYAANANVNFHPRLGYRRAHLWAVWRSLGPHADHDDYHSDLLAIH